MSLVIIRKCFIVGVVCLVCSEQDKIQMWEEDGVLYCECVVCGYVDMFNVQGQLILKELGMWVNQNVLKLVNLKVQLVQFFFNFKLKKKFDV